MNKPCKKCGYYIYLDKDTWYDEWDDDEVCYDENTNMIGDGKHYPEE